MRISHLLPADSLAGYGPWGYKELDTTEHESMHIKFIKMPLL